VDETWSARRPGQRVHVLTDQLTGRVARLLGGLAASQRAEPNGRGVHMAEQIGDGEVVARVAPASWSSVMPVSTSIMRWRAGDRSITNFLRSFASRMTLLHQ
jgi:hypothetical protein